MIKRIIFIIINFIFPNRCIFCNEIVDRSYFYCDRCYFDIPFVVEPTCEKCGRPLYSEEGYKSCPNCAKTKMYFETNYPCFLYTGVAKEALLKYKFADEMWYYRAFGNFMYNKLRSYNIIIDYIVYPDVNNKTFYKRGYNQSQLIAEYVGKKLNIPVLKTALKKVKQNNKQSLTSAAQRRQNVKGVFALRDKYKNLIKDKNILIIDDIYTTGATINECSKILKQNGAKLVYASTLCIVK